MTPEQREEFAIRADLVKYKHLKNDPTLRRARRKFRLSIVSAVVGACVTIAVMLMLTKSFMMALHGPDAYARIIAPSVQTQDEGALLRQALMPDPVSSEIAEMLSPFLQQSGPMAETAPSVAEDGARDLRVDIAPDA